MLLRILSTNDEKVVMSQTPETSGSIETQEFGPAYPPVNIDYSGEDSPYGPPLQQTLMHITTKLPPGSTLLDIGGSDGRYSIPLAKAGYNVVIFDLISESLEAAERHAAEEGVSDRITVQQGDVYKPKPFDFREKDFDATLNAAFISLHNPEQAKEMNRKAVTAQMAKAMKYAAKKNTNTLQGVFANWQQTCSAKIS
jgi:tRNA A58 N-methylase Trm61